MTAPALRALLAKDFLDIGPDAPTLCEGWRSRHLAAHLVIREHQPWRIMSPKATISTGDEASSAFPQLVARFAAGPGRFSLFRLIDEPANFLEYVVHREDLLRANDTTGTYTPGQRREIWSRAKGRARGKLGVKDTRVEIIVDDLDADNTLTIGKQDGSRPGITVRGPLLDVVLLAHGRPADLDITGPDDLVAAYRAKDRSV